MSTSLLNFTCKYLNDNIMLHINCYLIVKGVYSAKQWYIIYIFMIIFSNILNCLHCGNYHWSPLGLMQCSLSGRLRLSCENEITGGVKRCFTFVQNTVQYKALSQAEVSLCRGWLNGSLANPMLWFCSLCEALACGW